MCARVVKRNMHRSLGQEGCNPQTVGIRADQNCKPVGGTGIGFSERAVNAPVFLVRVDPVHAGVAKPPGKEEVVRMATEVDPPLRLAMPAQAMHCTVWHVW